MLVMQFVRQLRSFNFDVSDFSCGGGQSMGSLDDGLGRACMRH